MQAKKDLARRIVADFHSAEAAAKSGEDWAKQFQKDERPEAIELVEIPFNDIGGADGSVMVDKLVSKAGLASSVTDAQRKREQGAVKINGQKVDLPKLHVDRAVNLEVRVGRQMKLVRIISPGSDLSEAQ
jgi:tyrosyl-tRNA synthetase